MRLADDDRARIPFALVAVLLLVGSATFAATLRGRAPGGADPDAEAAIDRAGASTRAALSTAVQDAAREAASDPLTVANTSTEYGRVLAEHEPFGGTEESLESDLMNGEAPDGVLDPADPFWSYLSLRIYLSARESLDGVEERVDGVRASPSLRPIDDADGLERALGAVTLNLTGGTPTVTVENVTLTAERGTRTILRENRTYRVTVETPVPELHERVRLFEAQLDGGIDSGFGRRLTGRMYAVAWARGYAQYGGAPIDNVVTNRHTEIMANDAILKTQMATLGRRDPDGHEGTKRAGLRVGFYDLVNAVDHPSAGWFETVLGGYSGSPGATWPAAVDAPEGQPPAPEDETTVAVNRTADVAFLDLVAGENPDRLPEWGSLSRVTGRLNDLLSPGSGESLEQRVRSWYAVEANLTASVEPIHVADPRSPPRPDGEGWERGERRVDANTTVVGTYAPDIDPPDGWTVDDSYAHGLEVRRTHNHTRLWTRGNETRTTSVEWTGTYRVDLAVLVDADPDTPAPDRPVENRSDPGGPLDGDNFATVPERAHERLVAEPGLAELAGRAVDGELNTTPVRVEPELPDGLADWVYDDLAGVRERVRGISTRVEMGKAVTTVSPPAELLDAVEDNRTALVDAPENYSSVAERVRFDARVAYLDAVETTLARQDQRFEESRRTIGERLPGDMSMTEMVEYVGGRLSNNVANDDTRRVSANGTHTEIAGPEDLPLSVPDTAVVSVDGDPPYLTLAAVDHRRVRAVDPETEAFYPLSTKNKNYFTLPYAESGGIVGQATDDLLNEDRVSVGTGARALARAAQTHARADDDVLQRAPEWVPEEEEAKWNLVRTRGRHLLEKRLNSSLESFGRDAFRVLGNETDLNGTERSDVIDDAMGRWDTTHEKALAIVNHSAASAIADEAAERGDLDDRSRDEIELWLRNAFDLGTVSNDLGPKRDQVAIVDGESRRIATDSVEKVVNDRVERRGIDHASRWYGEELTRVPAGMPVLPVVEPTFFTFNVWKVEVKGTYARFTVRAEGSPGDGPDATIPYTRDGDPVELDVDGDGVPDRLGRSERISFTSTTWIVVVVPPKGAGVGDVDGNRVETSPGWPYAGVAPENRSGGNGILGHVRDVWDGFASLNGSEIGEWGTNDVEAPTNVGSPDHPVGAADDRQSIATPATGADDRQSIASPIRETPGQSPDPGG